MNAARLERLGLDLAAARGGARGADAERERGGRRGQGAYFTPEPLVRFVVAETLAPLLSRRDLAWRADGSPELVVLDPAAGDGRFLRAARDHLAAEAARRGRDGAAGAIARRCLIGVERDPAFAEAAREAVPGATIHCAEALIEAPIADGSVDAVVGNPPYLRSLRFADPALRAALRGRFCASERGEWDLYAVFLERALEWARGGGEVGLVVPSRWWTAACAEPLRRKLAAARSVRALVDFGAEQVFADATTYASVAFLSKRAQRHVAVARRRDGWSLGQVGAAELGGAPWRLSVGASRRLLDRLAGGGPALGDVARIAKGTGTNADGVFVFEGAAPVEDELLVPVLRGRDVRPFGAVDPRRRLLLPYDRGGQLIGPAEMQRRYPRAMAYLLSQRARLEARERGRFRGERFYCFGRPQNLAFLADRAPKVVIPDVAKRGRALLDASGAMVLDSAYAIRLRAPAPYELAHILAVLSSSLPLLWLQETGMLLRGGYVRMKTETLRSLPLPPPDSVHLARAAAAATSAAADRAEVDELVRRACGVARAEWPTS